MLSTAVGNELAERRAEQAHESGQAHELNASRAQRRRQARGRRPRAIVCSRCGMTTDSIPAPRAIASPPASANVRDHDGNLRAELPCVDCRDERLQIGSPARDQHPQQGDGALFHSFDSRGDRARHSARYRHRPCYRRRLPMPRRPRSRQRRWFLSCCESKRPKDPALPKPKRLSRFSARPQRGSRALSRAVDFVLRAVDSLASGRGASGYRNGSRV